MILLQIKRFVIAFLVLLFVFFTLAVLVCAIPFSSLKNNVGESLKTFKQEGTYPSFGLPMRSIVLDNFTDSMMFNTAYSVDSSRPVFSAITNRRFVDPDNRIDQINSLEKLYLGKSGEFTNYERYWHGYLVYLRPLLTVFPYSAIRNIVAFFLYAGLIWFLYLSWKKLGKKETLFFLFAFILVDFFFIGRSLQFSSVFLIGLFSSIYYLLNYRKNNFPYVLFFIVGGLTSFFDLLTAPLVGLGMLLAVSTVSDRKQNIFLNCLSWGVGYLSLWASKWLAAAVLFSPNAITTALDQIVNRTVNKADAGFSQMNALQLNFWQLIGYGRQNKIILLSFFIVFLIFLLKYFSFKKSKIKRIIPWLIIGAIPYLWYLVAANHSYLHVWYTYRNQFMSVVSFFMIVAEFIDWQRVSRDFKLLSVKFTSEGR